HDALPIYALLPLVHRGSPVEIVEPEIGRPAAFLRIGHAPSRPRTRRRSAYAGERANRTTSSARSDPRRAIGTWSGGAPSASIRTAITSPEATVAIRSCDASARCD